MKVKKVLQLDNFRNRWEKLFFNFQLTQSNINRYVKNCFKNAPITYQQYMVLSILSGANEPVNQAYVKERIVDKDSDVSRLIGRLVQLGYITKKLRPDDKRHALIELSDSGRAVHEQMLGQIHTIDEVFFNLSRAEVKQLNAILDKIRES